MNSSFWNDARLLRLSVVVLIGLLIALPIAYTRDTEKLSMIRSGDFPGFYVQGEILRRGQSAQLYDPELQRAIQNEFWPSFNGAFYMAVYPPYTAALLYPFSFFPPQEAQFLFIGIMLIFYALTFYLLDQINTSLKHRSFSLGAITLFCSTMIAALFGAQNTALSMVLAAGSIYYLKNDSPRSQWIRGVLIGLWLFKPQFALFALIFAFLSAPSWRVLVGFTGAATTFYCIGAYLLGFFWPLTWLESIRLFGALNYIHNRQEMLSLIGVSKAIGFNCALDTTLFSLLGWLTTGALFIWAARCARVHATPSWMRFALAVSLFPLLSPQTLFYDLGIGIVGLLALMNMRTDKNVWMYLALISVSMFSFALRETSIIPPFFHLALLTALLSVWVFRSETASITAQNH